MGVSIAHIPPSMPKPSASHLQGEYLDCHTPIYLKLPGAEVGVTVRCPMLKFAAEVYFYYVKNSVKN